MGSITQTSLPPQPVFWGQGRLDSPLGEEEMGGMAEAALPPAALWGHTRGFAFHSTGSTKRALSGAKL